MRQFDQPLALLFQRGSSFVFLTRRREEGQLDRLHQAGFLRPGGWHVAALEAGELGGEETFLAAPCPSPILIRFG